MYQLRNFRDVIDACGHTTGLASALNIEHEAVRKWRQRNRIPVEYWQGVIAAARFCGENVTADDLTRMVAKSFTINVQHLGTPLPTRGRPRTLS